MELFENGYTPDKIMLAYQENRSFTTEVFERWAFEVFFPEMQRRRERYNYDGEILLILDGFGPHSSDEFPNCCTENGVIPFPISRVYTYFLQLYPSNKISSFSC